MAQSLTHLLATLRRLSPMRNAFSVVTAIAVAGAVLSFAREALFGRTFGAGAATDGYFTSFVVVNTVTLVFATSLASAIPPLIFATTSPSLPERPEERAGAAIAISVIVFGLPSLLLGCFPDSAVSLVAPASSRGTVEQAIEVLRALAPSILLSGVASVVLRVLQANERFGRPGLVNLLAIAPPVLLLGFGLFTGLQVSVVQVALAILLGSALQLVVLLTILQGAVAIPGVAAIRTTLRYTWHLIGFALAYNVFSYYNVLWERRIASTLGVGAISEFAYATRIFALLTTFGVSPITAVFFPRYSSRVAEAGANAARHYLDSWLFRIAIMGGLALTAFVGGGSQLVAFVYGHSRFAPGAVLDTYAVLAIYSVGAVMTSVGALLISANYALRRAWVPLAVAGVDAIIYMVVSTVLATKGGLRGLAAARLASFFFVLVVLLILSARPLATSVVRTLVAVTGCTVLGLIAAMMGLNIGRLVHLQRLSVLPSTLGQEAISTGLYACAVAVVLLVWSRVRPKAATAVDVGTSPPKAPRVS